MILKLKIDVTKLDKNLFFKGKKGTYADLTAFVEDEEDQFGQFGRIVQDIPQERRENGERAPIVGNIRAKHDQMSRGRTQSQPPRQQSQPPAADDWGDDDDSTIPF